MAVAPGPALRLLAPSSYAANPLVVSGEWLRADMGKSAIVVPILVAAWPCQ